jgi:hypothetical protein
VIVRALDRARGINVPIDRTKARKGFALFAPPKKKFFAIIQKITWKLVKWRCADARVLESVFKHDRIPIIDRGGT